jgi:hypothetical protein
MDPLRRKGLRNLVDESRAEYHRLNDVYDFHLKKAHEFDHGSPDMIEALKKANRIGKEVSAALQRYQDAVEKQAALYSTANPRNSS